jgi:hypothetical protein
MMFMSAIIQLVYFCRYRDIDKRIDKRRRRRSKTSGGGEEQDDYSGALLEYLASVISYIYRWDNTASLEKDFDISVKLAAIRILQMDDRLTEVRMHDRTPLSCDYILFTYSVIQ